MTQQSGTFGDHLAAHIKDAGVSVRQLASRAGVSEGTIRGYVRGYIDRAGKRIPIPPTVPTIVKLADALQVRRADLLAAAGLEAPRRVLAQQPDHDELSIDQLIDMLRERVQRQRAAGLAAHFTVEQELMAGQIRTRGTLIAELNRLADEARETGDDAAADAICDLVEAMDAQLTAMSEAEVKRAQEHRHRPVRPNGR